MSMSSTVKISSNNPGRRAHGNANDPTSGNESEIWRLLHGGLERENLLCSLNETSNLKKNSPSYDAQLDVLSGGARRNCGKAIL